MNLYPFSGVSLPAVTASAFVALISYGIIKFVRHRRLYGSLPGPPHDFIWGHLKVIGELGALFPNTMHMQTGTVTLAKKYNLPGIFYIDPWPLFPPMTAITDPDLATHLMVTKNLPKHAIESQVMGPILGTNNILLTNGAAWKRHHNMIATAFGESQVKSLVPMIADEAMTFRSILAEKAATGEPFELEKVASSFTFDVITTTTFGTSLESQRKGSDLLKHFSAMIRENVVLRDSWDPVKRYMARRRMTGSIKAMEAYLEKRVRQRYETLLRENIDLSSKKGLSNLDLLLRDTVEQTRASGESYPPLDKEIASMILANLKVLLLGGTGTTADTICFCFMLLSTHPSVLQKLREEHDRVFHPSISTTYQMLRSTPTKINELEYTTNVLRETLRFYPVGFTARSHGDLDTVTWKGISYPLKNTMICPIQLAMHFSSTYFPNPGSFSPDRFTHDSNWKHFWRPFERGPRACLGQTMAMDELKIALLLTVRDFDFACHGLKPYAQPRVDWFGELDTVFGDRAYQEYLFEAKPRDGMPMVFRGSGWYAKK